MISIVLPLTAPIKVYSTSQYYEDKIVSLGDSLPTTFKFDGVELNLANNRLRRVKQVDERNLIYC